tara:strand:+ start:355 stop:474 length:120 start_codon:yes stop_codon:yes gene_type:complete
MEFILFLLLGLVISYYLLRPISKQEEKSFENKNNWRGGF